MVWPSMITLVVKGVDPLDGWLYLGQKGANSGHHCTRLDCRAGRALFETVTGQQLFPRPVPSLFESFPVVLLDDLSVVRVHHPFVERNLSTHWNAWGYLWPSQLELFRA